ncbi:hypothetical protein ABKV19_022156 [Rosa sericea]
MDSMRKAWKYLEEQFDTNLNELQTRLQELQIREEEISNREKRLEDKESKLERLDKLIEYKGEEYDAMEEAITEKQLQVEQVKTELQSISLLVEEKSQELDSKEKRVLEVEELLRKKDKECALMQNRIEEGRNNLSRVEKSTREMDIKVKTSMEDWSGKVDLKERQIEGLLKPNVEQLLLAYNMIEEYFNEVERKERGLKQQAKDLESKEREVALKADELKLTETTVKKRLNKVQLKEKHFDSLEKSLKADKQHLGSLLKSTEECKKDLASISHQLQVNERELAQQAKELELKQKQFSSQAKTKHLEPAPADNNATVPSSTIDHSCINIDVMSNKEEPESSLIRNAANLQPNTTRDDRNVPGLLNENFSCNHSVQSDLAAYLRSVPDPAKVVLNSVRNSIRPYLRKGYFEESEMSRNISLLKELMIVSPHVGSHLKVDARYLATQWKIKMEAILRIQWRVWHIFCL